MLSIRRQKEAFGQKVACRTFSKRQYGHWRGRHEIDCRSLLVGIQSQNLALHKFCITEP